MCAADNRLARFAAVGVGAALLLFGLSWAFVALGIPSFVAGTAAYAIAFAVAYTLQRSWTFQTGGSHARTLPRYLALQVACALANGLAFHAMRDWLGQPDILAAGMATITTSAISYVGSSRWVFADAPPHRT